MDTLEDRVRRLERENQRLKRVGLLAVLAISSVFLMGQARMPERIEAESFVVKDRRGITLAVLGAAYPTGTNTAYPTLSYYSYAPDGSSSIGTYLEGGAGEPARLRLGSAKGSIYIQAEGDGSGPSFVAHDGSRPVWSAP